MELPGELPLKYGHDNWKLTAKIYAAFGGCA